MPVAPLFASRLQFITDESLPIAERFAKFQEQIHEYVSPAVITRDVSFLVNEGQSDERMIRARWYRSPKAVGPRPVLIWFHGGGYEEGDFNMIESHVFAMELADRGLINLFNVDYSKCKNGVQFPTPLEDGYAALKYVAANIGAVESDPKHIYVGGISAGGALAAVVATMDRDAGTHLLAGAMLNCPVLHRVIPEFSDELVADLTQWPFYLDNRSIEPLLERIGGDVAGAPDWWWAGDISDFAGLPPMQIINCQYDGLRASGEKYAADLAAAGVEVEVSYQPGVPHAHINRIPDDCTEVVETMESMLSWINSR